MIATQGGLVFFAGYLEKSGHDIPTAWSIAFFVAAAAFAALFLYHLFILPYPAADHPAKRDPSTSVAREFLHIFGLFFRKKDIIAILAFFLFYRLAETQLFKMIAPFLLDPRSKEDWGSPHRMWESSTARWDSLHCCWEGFSAGMPIYRKGLRFWIWIMVCAMHLPDLVFVYLSQAMPKISI